MKNAFLNAVVKLPSPKGRFGAIVFMGLTVLLPAANAQVTYSYTGNPFSQFSCGPANPGPGTIDCSTPAPTNTLTSYTATDHVTATLSFTSALPANMAYSDVSGLPGFLLTLNDGQQTVSSANAPGGIAAFVSTDASGQISSWRLVVNTGGFLDGGIATINFTDSFSPFQSHVFDQGVLACCDPNPPGNLASNSNMPGTWSGGSVTPSGMVMNLIQSLNDPALGLTGGQIHSLTDKLNNVLLSIQAGLDKQAINQLNAFINSVRSSQKTGKMSQTTATTLLTDAHGIIAVL